MSGLIDKAKMNNRKALKELYNYNKNKVMLICKLLLNDEKAAASVMISVFKDSLASINTTEIISETDFSDLVNGKAVNYCKRQILKKNPKAYQMPARKVFDESDNELQRLVYIGNEVAGLSDKKLAKATELNDYTLRIVMDSDLSNISKILNVEENEKNIAVSQNTDTQIVQFIDNISAYSEKEKRKKNIITAIIACSIIAVIVILAFAFRDEFKGNKEKSDVSNTAEEATNDTSAEEASDSDETSMEETTFVSTINPDWYADIEIENYGTITVGLDSSYAPKTVANFVSLSQSGFYDGLTFHRIIEGFMMQGGAPEGNRTGGSEETIYGEFTDNGSSNNLSHIRGAISMARSTAYDSASTQFFIVQEDSTYLDGKYAVFGYVIEGIEIVDEICTTAEPTDSNGTISDDEQPVIKSITVYQ